MAGICLKHGAYLGANCKKCQAAAKPLEISAPNQRVFDLPKGPYSLLFMGTIKEAVQTLLKNYASSVSDDRIAQIYNAAVNTETVQDLVRIPDDWTAFATQQLGRPLDANTVYNAVTTNPPPRPGISPLEQYEVMEAMIADRRYIYVPSEATRWDTLLHEMLHLASDVHFRSSVSQQDPILGKLNEGVTEFSTRAAAPDTDRSGCYDQEFSSVRDVVADGAIDKPLLLAAYFKGEKAAIEGLKDAIFAKREEQFQQQFEAGKIGMDMNQDFGRRKKKQQ